MADSLNGKKGGRDQPASQKQWPAGECRAFPRHSFVATVEVTERSSGARLSARSSELGLGGCYIDTLNPFPEESLIRVRIVTDKGTFEADAKVCYTQPGFGMGVAFTEVAPEQRKVLEGWLAETGG